MTVQVPVNGVPELPNKQRLTTTARTTVYTNGAPAGSSKLSSINSIAIANEDAGGASTVLIEYSINSGSTYFLLWSGTIAALTSLAADIPGLPLFLNAGGILAATAGTANRLTVTTSSVMMG